MDIRYRIEKDRGSEPGEILFSCNVGIQTLCEKLGLLLAQALQTNTAVTFRLYDQDKVISEIIVPPAENV